MNKRLLSKWLRSGYQEEEGLYPMTRGVSLSREKTKITPLSEGFDFLGQTVRKHTRRNGASGKLQITPSKASFRAIKMKLKTLCKRHKGATPEELINTLNPVLRGWANYHRPVICGEMFNKVDSFVWGRVYRWCKRRHPDKTGRWIAERYFLSKVGKGWQSHLIRNGMRTSRTAIKSRFRP